MVINMLVLLLLTIFESQFKMIIFINCRLHSGQIKAEPGNPWGGSDYPGGHPNPVPEFPSASSVHPLERNYSPHPGYPNMPSTGTRRDS